MSSDREVITTISPADGKPVCTRTGILPTEIDEVCSKATSAFDQFRRLSLSERLVFVKRALSILNNSKTVLARDLTEHMGRPIQYTENEITTAIARAEYLIKVSHDALADSSDQPQKKGFNLKICKLPVGPVFIIFAWNYPYLIIINSLIPALLSGNSVILKPSPQTPTVAEHIKRIFEEAGLPDHVIQFFHSGLPETIATVVRRPEIKAVCFTGSFAGGLTVQKAAADRIDVRVGLELGGNDPAYVREDVDVDAVAVEIVDGAIFNSGQSCCSVERVYVHASVYPQFIKAVQTVLASYILGDPKSSTTQIGPVISAAAARRIRAEIQEALSQGAVDQTPHNPSFSSSPNRETFVAPVLLTDVNHDMSIMTEETFGPVIPVMKVDSDEEAIRLMNDSSYGLTASVWTQNEAKGESLAQLVDAGTVFVNRCDFPSPELAWIGWKNSGKGFTLSKFGFDHFVKLKSYHIKDYALVKVV